MTDSPALSSLTAGPERRTFEYLQQWLDVDEIRANRLNRYGAFGWELIHISLSHRAGDCLCIFKREVIPDVR